MEGKMAAGAFGSARNYGWDGPFNNEINQDDYSFFATRLLMKNFISRTLRYKAGLKISTTTVTLLDPMGWTKASRHPSLVVRIWLISWPWLSSPLRVSTPLSTSLRWRLTASLRTRLPPYASLHRRRRERLLWSTSWKAYPASIWRVWWLLLCTT